MFLKNKKNIYLFLILVLILFLAIVIINKKNTTSKTILAFVSARDNSYKIYVKDLSKNKKEEPISEAFYFIENISFLHNSPKIIINGVKSSGEKNCLYLLDTKTKTMENLTPNITYYIFNFTISPDDKYICLEANQNALFLLNMETRTTNSIVYASGTMFSYNGVMCSFLSARSPFFSPDGKKICFVGKFYMPQMEDCVSIGIVDVNNPAQINFIQLLRNKRAEKKLQKFTTIWGWDLQEYFNPQWSPDGNKIAFLYHLTTYTDPPQTIKKIYITNPDGADLKEVLNCFDSKNTGFCAARWGKNSGNLFYFENVKVDKYQKGDKTLDYRNYLHIIDIVNDKNRLIDLKDIRDFATVYEKETADPFNHYGFMIDENNKKVIFCAHSDFISGDASENYLGPFKYEIDKNYQIYHTFQKIYMVDLSGVNLRQITDGDCDYSPTLYYPKR